MHFGKGPKCLPIPDFVPIAGWFIRFGLEVASLTLSLQPQVDRIATDVEQLTNFAFLHAIELNRLDHLLTQVVTVGSCHTQIELNDRELSLVYVLIALTTAISKASASDSSEPFDIEAAIAALPSGDNLPNERSTPTAF